MPKMFSGVYLVPEYEGSLQKLLLVWKFQEKHRQEPL